MVSHTKSNDATDVNVDDEWVICRVKPLYVADVIISTFTFCRTFWTLNRLQKGGPTKIKFDTFSFHDNNVEKPSTDQVTFATPQPEQCSQFAVCSRAWLTESRRVKAAAAATFVVGTVGLSNLSNLKRRGREDKKELVFTPRRRDKKVIIWSQNLHTHTQAGTGEMTGS